MPQQESIIEPGQSAAASTRPPRSIPAQAPEPAGEAILEGSAPERSAYQSGTAIAPCVAQLKPEFDIGTDSYPGGRRVNYGSAVITVRYALDAQGETVDDETAVVGDSSNATRPRFLDALASDTVELVKNWEFAFAQGDDCTRPQVQTAVFRYRSKCVGAPVPKCRTIQSDVTLMTGS